MTEPTNGQSTGIIAILQRAGRQWRGLIGDTAGDAPRILAWETFDEAHADRIADWIATHDAERVVGVLPASVVVCRTCALPHTDAIHLHQALQLQAEAHLIGTAPAHRQAMAVLENVPGETSRTGIMLSWPEAAPFELPATGLDATYASDIAALAALLDGHRPEEPLLWLDRFDGSVALVMTHAGGATFRAARELADTEQGWSDRVGAVLAETALDAGHTVPFTESLVQSFSQDLAGFESDAGQLRAPDEILQSAQQRVHGAPTETDWWRRYGVTVGALLAGTNHLAPLTQLRRDAPIEKPSTAQRVLGAMSNKKTAVRIVIACVVILAFWPLASAHMRLLALQIRFADIEGIVLAAQENQTRLEMYRALKQHAWPMTKLLSDIACNTPRGIELQLIDLKHDGDVFSVSGTTKPHKGLSAQEVVAQMQQNLRATGIFTEIYYSWGDPNNFGAYEFTLSGKVAHPYRTYDYPVDLDFGQWTLADRLYKGDTPPKEAQSSLASTGTEAPASETVVAEDDPGIDPGAKPEDAEQEPEALVSAENGRRAAGTRPRSVPRNSQTFIPGDAPLSHDDRSRGGALPASRNVPEPLSEAQINAMTLPEVTESLGLVATALQRSHPDDATRDRLRTEFKLLMERKRAGR